MYKEMMAGRSQMRHRPPSGSFNLSLQIELQAGVTKSLSGLANMNNILNRAKRTCKFLKNANRTMELAEILSTVYGKVHQLERFLFDGNSGKEDVEKSHGLVQQCMDLVQSNIIPSLSALPSALEGKLPNIQVILSQLLGYDFQMADSFFYMSYLRHVGMNVFNVLDFNPTSSVANSVPSLEEAKTKAETIRAQEKESKTQVQKKGRNKRKPNKVGKGTGQKDLANQSSDIQSDNLPIVQQVENIVATGKIFSDALSTLKQHLQSSSSNDQFDILPMISLMCALHNEIEVFLATRIRFQHTPIVNAPADTTSEAQASPSSEVHQSPESAENADGEFIDDEDDQSGHINSSDSDHSEYDDMDLLNLLQKPDAQSTYTKPTEELLEEMARLCEERGVRDVVWSHAAREKNCLIVRGRGVSEEVRDELEAEMGRQHPSHKYVFVELADSTSTDLSCVVVKQKRAEPETYSLWEDADKATCEVVLKGKQPHKGDRNSYFAATSAHLLLNEDERNKISVTDITDQAWLEYYRQEVYKRVDKCVYRITLSNNQEMDMHLCNPPLIGFRTSCARNPSYSVNDKTCNERKLAPSEFMDDIALLPIESTFDERIRDLVTSNDIPLSGIYPRSASTLSSSMMDGLDVYASKGRCGRTLPQEQKLLKLKDSDREVMRGLHIPFFLVEGEPFEEGDSGSVIYVKMPDPSNPSAAETKFNMAIGILKCRRKPPQDEVYEAVVLAASLASIQKDYKHLVTGLKLHLTGERFPRKVKKEGKGPVPAENNVHEW